jgi:hypothetical protein
MTRQARLYLATIAIAGALVAWLVLKPGGDRVAIDLVQTFPSAKDKRPSPEVFSIVDATLGGVTRHAIATDDPSRIVWTVTVPDRAWLKVSLALREQAWTMQGDGVLFQIGIVGASRRFDDVMSLVVNPFANPADRGWQDLVLDLSHYAGQSVDVVLNTYSSPPPAPGAPPRDDRNGDMALWGAPRIVVR